jgi:hypothetical protein
LVIFAISTLHSPWNAAQFDLTPDTCDGNWAWDPGIAAQGWRTWKPATSLPEIQNATKAGPGTDAIHLGLQFQELSDYFFYAQASGLRNEINSPSRP